MATPSAKKKPEPQPDEDWIPEGAEGASDEWMPEGAEGAESHEASTQPEATPVAAVVAPGEGSLPQIGAGETFINRAANALPVGKPTVDAIVAAELQASRGLGRMLPNALARRLPGVIAEPGARLTPQAKAELEAMGTPAEVGTAPGPLDTYRDVRDTRAARTELGSEQNPWAGRAGTGAGMLLSAGLPLPAFKAGGEAATGLTGAVAAAARPTVLRRALASAATGVGYGALGGLTDGPADLTRGDFSGAGRDALIGGSIGGVLGGALPAVTTPGNIKRSMAAGATLGAGVGALSGLSGSKDTGDVLENAAIGAGAGLSLPLALGLGQRIYRGVVKPTDAAKYLREKGVKLTTGQMNPEGKLAALEEISSSAGGFGPVVKSQREAATQSWQDAVLNEARPPNTPPLSPLAPIDERLAEAYRRYEEAYAPAKGIMVEAKNARGYPLVQPPPPQAATPPAAAPTPAGTSASAPGVLPTPAAPATKLPLTRDAKGRFLPRGQQPGGAPGSAPATPPPPPTPTAFSEAVGDARVLATDSDRAVVKKFLDNEVTLLRKTMTGDKVASDVLIAMRSNVRAKIGQALKSQNFPQAQLLENAERELTDILEASLPETAARALRSADAQYAKYKPAESAVARSGDSPGGFTPAQLSAGVREDLEKGAYARGAGGEMRKLAAAGREVLEARIPKTGVQQLGQVPIIGAWGAAPMSYAANLPRVQQFLLGETWPQRAGQTVEGALARYIQRNPAEAEVGALMSSDNDERMQRQRAIAEALRRGQ